MKLIEKIETALRMYDAYTKSSVQSRIARVKAIFDLEVADEDRTFVFGTFLRFLQDDGIDYTVADFQAAA